MKKNNWNRKNTGGLVTALILSMSLATTAVLADAGNMQSGKQSFEKKCGACHSLRLPFTMTMGREEWKETVKTMVTYGAELDKKERSNVTYYLAARSSFTNHCSSCHKLNQVVSDEDKKRDWIMTINQMSDHFDELAFKEMTRGKTKITDDEKAEIADLLTVLLESS